MPLEERREGFSPTTRHHIKITSAPFIDGYQKVLILLKKHLIIWRVDLDNQVMAFVYEEEKMDIIKDNLKIYLDSFFRNNSKTKMLSFLSKELRECRKEYYRGTWCSLDDLEQKKILSGYVKCILSSPIYAFYLRAREGKNDVNYFLRYPKGIFVRQEIREKVYLSVVCIVKNEAVYIKEWIEFHKMQGVERFYIFDNESTDNTKDVLKPYIKAGDVVYISVSGKCVQMESYRYAIRKFGHESRWIAFIDSDEFLFATQGENLKMILSEYEDYPGVGVNWVVYGPCGHETRPEGLLIDNYLLTFADKNNEFNLRIKSIVQPDQVISVPSPHYFTYRNGRFAVDENFNEIDGKAMYIPENGQAFTIKNSVNRLRINHYWTKSKQEFYIKCQRGYPNNMRNPDYERGLNRFDSPLVEDLTALQFSKILSKMLDTE